MVTANVWSKYHTQIWSDAHLVLDTVLNALQSLFQFIFLETLLVRFYLISPCCRSRNWRSERSKWLAKALKLVDDGVGIGTRYPISWRKAMAPHSSTLAWKIPWTKEPSGLQSMGSLRVGHDWATSLSLFTFIHWRREWQPTPVFLPGESQGWWSLVGCRLWGRTESDTTEAT